jgi:hypothetical protein
MAGRIPTENWHHAHVLGELKELVKKGLHLDKVAVYFGYSSALQMRRGMQAQDAAEALRIIMIGPIEAELELLKKMWETVNDLGDRNRFTAICKLLDRFERLSATTGIPAEDIRKAVEGDKPISRDDLLKALRPEVAN